MLTTHLSLVSRLRITGTVPPFLLYTIITCVETALSFCLAHRRQSLTTNHRILLQLNILQIGKVSPRCQTGLCGQSALSTCRRNPREGQSYLALMKCSRTFEGWWMTHCDFRMLKSSSGFCNATLLPHGRPKNSQRTDKHIQFILDRTISVSSRGSFMEREQHPLILTVSSWRPFLFYVAL